MRQNGFYFIKVTESWQWAPALHEYGKFWMYNGGEGMTGYSDEQLFAINESRIPSPDENIAKDNSTKDGNVDGKKLLANPNDVRCDCGASMFYQINGESTIKCAHCEREYLNNSGVISLIEAKKR